AQRPVGGEGQIAELVGRPARPVVLLIPEEAGEGVVCGVAPACLLHVLGAAAVARQLADDVILVGALSAPHDLSPLRVEVGKALACALDIGVELNAPRRAP